MINEFLEIDNNKKVFEFPYLTPHNYLIYEFTKDISNEYNKISDIVDITVGDKLGYNIELDNFYIDKSSVFQSFNRWYYKQTREKTLYYLDKYINSNIELCSKIIAYIQNNIISKKKHQKYDKPLESLNKLFVNLIHIVTVLRETYNADCSAEHIVNDITKMKEKLEKQNKVIETFFSINKTDEYSNVVFRNVEN